MKVTNETNPEEAVWVWDVLSGVAKMAWDVMSGWQKQRGMFCTGWQIFVGCFVRGVKKWHGMFCPGMFCPAPQPDQCLNLLFSFTMQLLHQLTFQTNYKFSPSPYNRLTIHCIPLICKRHRSHTLSQTFTLATFNFISSNQSTSNTNLLCIKYLTITTGL